ncbi:MAG: hypothetical protein GC159_04505 [Phycisphaera sp.]|nr:hypothetical protein [Phycisphaera sp.]
MEALSMKDLAQSFETLRRGAGQFEGEAKTAVEWHALLLADHMARKVEADAKRMRRAEAEEALADAAPSQLAWLCSASDGSRAAMRKRVLAGEDAEAVWRTHRGTSHRMAMAQAAVDAAVDAAMDDALAAVDAVLDTPLPPDNDNDNDDNNEADHAAESRHADANDSAGANTDPGADPPPPQPSACATSPTPNPKPPAPASTPVAPSTPAPASTPTHAPVAPHAPVAHDDFTPPGPPHPASAPGAGRAGISHDRPAGRGTMRHPDGGRVRHTRRAGRGRATLIERHR